jgi:acyl-coenzyme A synthetase/AMP-(fatty) acid ligase
MHPADAMLYWAKVYPQRLAVLLPYMAITYQAMAEAIEAISQRVVELQFDRLEPVAVFIEDPAKLITICFALVRNGISCAPQPQATIAHLQTNNIKTAIFSDAGDVMLNGRNVRFDDSWLKPRAPSSSAPALAPSNPSDYGDIIFFTSGSTGVPKKVIMSSDAFIERVITLTGTGEAAYGRVLMVPGLGSVFGFNRAATVHYAGKTVCFAYGPEAQLRFINTFGIEVVVASVQQIQDILAVLEKGMRYRSESLKEVWVSGGIATEELIKRIRTTLCRNVLNVYGSSESGFTASARYDMIAHVPQAVGFVRPDMEIEIVDAQGLPVPAGQEGLIRGRSRFIAEVFAAHNPNRANEANDAWWYPGDLGWMTEDAILCVSGRADDVINMGGVKIAAEVLDERIRHFPGVSDGGVCAVADSSGINEVWIGVVSDGEIDVAELKRSIETSQADLIKVGEIMVVDQIPRSDLGKLQRHDLKALLLGIKNRAAIG